jgi:23S rRNA (guanosine2251-2'-O)-methyltransferase
MSKPNCVTGLRAVEQLLATPDADVKRLFAEYQSANPRVAALIRTAQSRGIPVQPANRARLQQISGEVRHQGVVAQIRRSTVLDEAALRSLVEQRLTDADAEPLLLLVLDAVQDPHNLGACMRSADAAGVDAVIVPRHGAAGLGPTVSKVAAGAAESLPYAAVNNLGKTLAWMAEYGIRAVGTSGAADGSLYDADLAGPTALVMGGEHGGLSTRTARRCDLLVRLPMRGTVESLNVSVATGICLYEALRQRLSR